ncbi:LANO_0F05974g1_1 [Lachancea nothofagi CBS 11611]|uniref:LANO_0F05974g1_1 n=1 Tax=Lachancea nothofagi CBS 11611 TaxID=1266666 RepID=A0A1G4K899_9SACH|nr:LANO_0F05974g1_1 [Lachancea nothofagi CBS 11611]
MLVCVWWLWTSLTAVWAECDFARLSGLSQELRYDQSALPQYAQLSAQLALCDTQEANHLRHQLLYKSGLIQVSSGNELAALELFEAIQESPETSAFVSLAQKRLQEIYQEFGYWERTEDPSLGARYETLKGKLLSYLSRNELVPTDLLNGLVGLAPSSLDIRILINDALYYDLSRTLSINAAQSIIENYKIVLSKHKRIVSVTDKLHIHHAISVLQMFVMSTTPTNLMSCLALDMDYKPCRELSKLSSKLRRINPEFTSVMHPDQFLELSEFDWAKVLEFYIKSAKPIVFDGTKSGKNNLEVLRDVQRNLLTELLTQRTLSSIDKKWQLDSSASSAFTIFQDLILCEAYDQTSQTKIADTYYRAALKDKLPQESLSLLNGFTENLQNPENVKDILHNLWQDSPSLALHAVRKCLVALAAKEKTRYGIDTTQVWSLLENFAKDHEWDRSHNEAINKVKRIISNASAKKRRENQERFNQQQRQQQQRQQQQHQNAPPPMNDLSKKNLYKVLGLSQDASYKDIRKSYLLMTRKYHPDKQGQLSEEQKQKNEEKMSQINEAYEILSDEEKRKDYDNQRSGRGTQRQRSPFGNNNGGGFPFGGGNFKMNFGGFA